MHTVTLLFCSEFKKFVLNQDAFRQKWCEAELQLQNLQEKVRLLDTENGALQTRLKHARYLSYLDVFKNFVVLCLDST